MTKDKKISAKNFSPEFSVQFTPQIESFAAVNILRTKEAINLKFSVHDYI